MLNSKESRRTVSFFSSFCEVGNGSFQPEIPASEASYVAKPCTNPHDFDLVTCQSPNLDAFIEDAGGLKMDLPLSPSLDNVPFYIPSVDFATINSVQFGPQFPLVGISLKHVVSSTNWVNGGLRETKEIKFTIPDNFSELKKNSKIILFSTGTDTSIEHIWRKRNSSGFYEQIRKLDLQAAGGFNFSIFDGECPTGQILNQKRSLQSSYLYESNGIPSIPHVYASTPFQVERWVRWFIENESVTHFTVNCQFDKPVEDINQDIRMIQYIIDKVPRLHAILQGFPFSHIYKFGSTIANLHFADSTAYYQAKNYRQISVGSGFAKKIEKASLPFNDLVLINAKARKEQLEKISQFALKTKLRKAG